MAGRRPAAVVALVSALAAPAAADEVPRGLSPEDVVLTRDSGWPAGRILDQLNRDATLVPFGKGALFVPAMTNPLDEPPIAIYQGDAKVAEGTTGTRVVLRPGEYEVSLGTGTREQRISTKVVVREAHTVIVPVRWAGLSIHVVDEQYGSLRGSYELIRVEDREYIGIGFGTDEQAGEPVTTWILRPGLYKIVRVGDTYRARRDFATVRLVEGRHTHFLLVLKSDTGELAGGGETPVEDLFQGRQGSYGSLILGGDLSLNARSNVAGFQDGLSFAARAFVDARLSVELFGSPLLLQLQIEEGQTKSPDLPFQKTNDRLDLDGLYVYRLEPWIGPYARVGAETNLLPGFLFFEAPRDVLRRSAEGAVIALERAVEDVTVSPPLGLATLKEGAGLNLRLFKYVWAETTLRTGVGARHRLTRELFEISGEPDATPLELKQVDTTHQVGLEATLLGSARLTRWVLVNLEVDTLVPFNDLDQVVLEVEGSIALKLTSYLSVNYVARFLRDRALTPFDRLQQDVLVRFSVEIL